MAAYLPSRQSGVDPLAPHVPKRTYSSTSRGEWWFRLTAPQEPENATFAQREAVRRGRLASITILFISLFTLVPVPNALIHGQSGFLDVLAITLLLNAFALFVLNRKGHLIAAGWLVVTVLDLGFAGAFLAIPQGVTLGALPAFDLMAESLMVVVAFFPPRSVFVVMTINCAFIVTWLFFGKHTPDISQLLTSDPYNLFYPSLSLEAFEAVLAFLWVSSATKAISALDRSEEIVDLERREIEQQETQLALKRQLEDGIEQILQTHVKAANGDFTARAPLNRDNILWQIAYSLNNLLSRLQRNSQLQGEIERTHEAVKLLTEYVRSAKAGRQHLPPLQRTGTMVDELIVELMASNDNSLSTKRFQSLNEGSRSVFPEEPRNPGRDARLYPRRPHS